MPLYLLIVKYSSEAERKRLEYLLSSYKDRIDVRRPGGTILFIRGSRREVESLLEDLYSRLPSDEVSIYRLTIAPTRIEPRRAGLEVSSNMTAMELLGAIGAVLAGMRGVEVMPRQDARRVYHLNVRGGHIMVTIEAFQRGSTSRALVTVEGYGHAFERTLDMLSHKLSLVGKVRRVD